MEKIEILVKEYYEMEKGDFIQDINYVHTFENSSISIHIKNRALKHVVEERKSDGYDFEKLIGLVTDMHYLIREEKYLMVQNKKQEKCFLFLEKIFDKKKGVVMVVEMFTEDGKTYFLKTCFYRAANKIQKLIS
jgi:hypothetical protein